MSDIRKKQLAELEKRLMSLQRSHDMELEAIKKRHKREVESLSARYRSIAPGISDTSKIQ